MRAPAARGSQPTWGGPASPLEAAAMFAAGEPAGALPAGRPWEPGGSAGPAVVSVCPCVRVSVCWERKE